MAVEVLVAAPAHEVEVRLTQRLRHARAAVGRAPRARDADAEQQARGEIDAAKIALGERGPVWWTDGTADYHRRMARHTPHAAWFAALDWRRKRVAAPAGFDVFS